MCTYPVKNIVNKPKIATNSKQLQEMTIMCNMKLHNLIIILIFCGFTAAHIKTTKILLNIHSEMRVEHMSTSRRNGRTLVFIVCGDLILLKCLLPRYNRLMPLSSVNTHDETFTSTQADIQFNFCGYKCLRVYKLI